MSQASQHPAYLMIEDQLDAVGQKYRGHQILRGAIVWVGFAFAASFAATILAHFAGPGRITTLLTIAWASALTVTAAMWIIRPLLFRARSIEVARLVETRVPNLHNGLTNSVLLAGTSDLQDNPWLGDIFEEILITCRSNPIASAVRIADLKHLLLRLAAIIVPLLLLLAFPQVRASIDHGWRQMFNPAAFVPRVGSVRIIDIQPRQITLVTGQPLEITVLAEDPDQGTPAGSLFFEDTSLPPAQITPNLAADNQLRYSYRIDHVDSAMRFRVEIGGTQSPWCQVNVVRQVRLQELLLTITPPGYTRRPQQVLTLKADQIDKTPISAPEGSRIELAAVVDVPVKGALLRIGDLPPTVMNVAQDGRRFMLPFILSRDEMVSVLLKEGEQVIAALPDPPLRIACTLDAAPTIQMKWPAADLAVPPSQELKIQAILKDDHGLSGARVLMAAGPDAPLAPVHEQASPEGTTGSELSFILNIPQSQRVHGQSVRVQVETTDNRNLSSLVGSGLGAPQSAKDTGPQTTLSPIYEIKFRDPEQIAREQREQLDRLRSLLIDMIRKQQELLTTTLAWTAAAAPTMPKIHAGQVELRQTMLDVASTFPFEPDDRIIQKTLQVLAHNTAQDAIDLAQSIQSEPVATERTKQHKDLQSRQRRIIETLEALVTRLALASAPTTQPSKRGGDLENLAEKYKDLTETLKKFIAEEKRILDATATLAKKPVDDFDDRDRKNLEELAMAQEKLDAFMQEKISDFSKLAEQDMANASLLKELLEVYSEVTMAKNALKKQAVEMAIPAEEMGVELAQEITSNLEKWLMDHPEREKWNQEDPLTKTDVPMAELPKELEDMVGELMEDQEDMFEEIEDTAANWADSLDKGAGWDAADGPIANMSAKGVTGNQLPNNNEMNGRSGEGRSGKSSGEFVEETATGKGGRNTPTRLDPTAFQQGQIKDVSKDPAGGATGGGKLSGQGGAGLEGPVPAKDLRDKMQRLAQKQAELRNKAERLDLDKKVGAYDNFKLLESVAIMRRVESDLKANRYENALHRKDVLLDRLETSHLLLSGQIHLQRDTTPKMSDKMEEQIQDVLNGQLPPAWSEALKEYYRKLSQ